MCLPSNEQTQITWPASPLARSKSRASEPTQSLQSYVTLWTEMDFWLWPEATTHISSALSGNICVVETRTQHLQHLKPVLLRRDWQLKILLPLGGYQSSCLEECIQQLYAEFCEKPSQRARRVISVMSKKWSMLRNQQNPTLLDLSGFTAGIRDKNEQLTVQ